MARSSKKLKEEGPRYAEAQVLNRVAGEVLRTLLERSKLSSTQDPTSSGLSLGTGGWMAEGMGVSASTLSRMLSGRHSLTFENIWFAAEVLGIRPTQLVQVIEDAMQRVEGLELTPDELIAHVRGGGGRSLDALLREQFADVEPWAEAAQDSWRLAPSEEPVSPDKEDSLREWSSLFSSAITAPVVGSVLAAAAGVAAVRFFGRAKNGEVE